MKLQKSAVALVLCLAAMAAYVPALAVPDDVLDAAIQDAAGYVYNTVKLPQVGSVGGEWAVMELARSGFDVPESYYQDYYAAVEEYVEACGGVLHTKKYTEYSRVTLALTAIGKNPADVAGYDLLRPLGDYDRTIWQGLNGPIWALIALDTGDYAMPRNPEAETQATRAMYVDRILECQLPDGGWSLFGGTAAAGSGDGISDPDITGMALQALAKYQDREDVRTATEEALAAMSERQDDEGGYTGWGGTNLESVVQMLVALCELGIPIDDPRFVKNGNTLLDNIMTFYMPGKGFLHMHEGGGNSQMSTEQGLYGLIAAQRARDGMPSLYRMTDAIALSGGGASDRPRRGGGLPDKNSAVAAVPIVAAGIEFDDTYTHENLIAISALAARGIITGKGEGVFDPDATMTRAEFAAIATRALGLAYGGEEAPESVDFTDVQGSDWFYGPVSAAASYGIITGRGGGVFDPGGTITRQEAAAMAARAAALCGVDTALAPGEARDTLAQFGDYVSSAEWARESLALCYREGILPQEDMDIRPADAVLRCEVAQMLYNLLETANLI